jgi:penicillin-binding protein activator
MEYPTERAAPRAGARHARWAPRRFPALVAALVALGTAGCATQVVRTAPEQVIDLSGRWNDVDSRLVADTLIRQSLNSPWVLNHVRSHAGSVPTVIVGTIRNRSMEHIPVNTFIRDLENAFINSGMVRMVAGAEERAELRDERVDQQGNAQAETRARLGREIGANYMLQGEVHSIEDREGGRSVVFYQVDATLVDLESNSKIWVGQHKIKKFITRPRIGL